MSNHQINWNELGTQLKADRESQGYSIEEAALQTRIAPWIIDSLEKGEHSKLPGLVFAKGFVKNLAKIYSVDAQVYLEYFKEDLNVKPNLNSVETAIPKLNFDKPLKNSETSSNEVSMKTIEVASKPVLLPWSWILAITASLLALAVWISLIDRNSASLNSEVSQAELDLSQPVDNAVVESTTSNVDTSSDVTEFASQEVAETSKNPVDTLDAETKVPSLNSELVNETLPTPEPEKKVEESAKSPTLMNLALDVKESVQIRLKTDNQSQKTITLEPKLHRFEFEDKAELLIFDAAAAQVSFNGEDLGPLGGKGRVRRLSFVRALP